MKYTAITYLEEIIGESIYVLRVLNVEYHSKYFGGTEPNHIFRIYAFNGNIAFFDMNYEHIERLSK